LAPAGGNENAGDDQRAARQIMPVRLVRYGNLRPAEITAIPAILAEHLENYREFP